MEGDKEDEVIARLNQAGRAVYQVIAGGNADPMVEPLKFTEESTSFPDERGWRDDSYFVDRLRTYGMVGIALSTLGLVLLSPLRTRESTMRFGISDWLSVGILAAGLTAILALPPWVAVVAVMPFGIPSMIFGLSRNAGLPGRLAAWVSWAGMLGFMLFVVTWSQPRYSDWNGVPIPPSNGPPKYFPELEQKSDYSDIGKAVTAWLELIDAGDYEKAWRSTATLARTLESEPAWIAKIKGVREPLGIMEKRLGPSTGWTSELEGAPKGEYMILSYKSNFANRRDVVETVTLIYQEDGKWGILGYSIQ